MFNTVCYYCGVFFIARFIANRRGYRTTILTFHRIGESRNGVIKHSLPTSFVSKKNFDRIIKFLTKYYNVISLADYFELRNSKREIPKNTLIITFDDGYKDNYESAFPILDKYKVPATIFLTSSFINNDNLFWWDHFYALCKNCRVNSSLHNLPNEIYSDYMKKKLYANFAMDKNERDQLIWSLIAELHNYDNNELHLLVNDLAKRFVYDLDVLKKENKMLSWEDVRELETAGITFGSHTRSHLFLNGFQSENIVYDELQGSKRDIEKNLKSEIKTFAYPGGKISERLKEIVKKSGYKLALTQKPGINSNEEDLLALKRFNIWEGTVTGFWGRFSKSLLAMKLIKTGK